MSSNVSKAERWEILHQAIVEFASGNFNLPEFPFGEGDEVDALAEGVIMLGEELQAKTISDKYLNSVVEGLSDVLMVLDNNMAIKEINRAGIELLEFPMQILSKLNFSHLCPEILYHDEIALKLKKKEFDGLKNLELVLRSKSGRNVQVSASFSSISGNWKDGHEILFIARDISDLLSTRKLLENKNQELSTLIYRITHDLRAPLSNIMGLVEMARVSAASDDVNMNDILPMLGMMQTSAERLDKILRYFNQILFVHKTDTEWVQVDFDKVFNKAINSVRNEFANVDFECNLKADALDKPFIGPVDLIQSMAFNLVHNAVQYRSADRSCKVDIELRQTNNFIKIRVKDNGVGIDKDLQNDVFNMFVKVSAISDGAGLGLYFVKSLVEQLKGEISIDSVKNIGTTFTVYLPIQQD
ncbi:MAG: PAS domain-containing sensor histidine kinase [Bacteroidetes bacterium]|nr:PAS domain-containing sensor histidine kinase [Bacteroidota bacterium]